MSTSTRFLDSGPFAVAVALALLSLGCLGGAPLSVNDEVAPASCPAAASGTAGAAAGASVASVAAPDAGSTPIRTSFGLWMSNGFVSDMQAAGFGGSSGAFEVADAFSGFVSYGMDIVMLRQSGTLAAAFGSYPTGVPDSLIVGGFQNGPDDPIVPRTGYWLARLVYGGMTNAVETTKGDTTIRESPGGRVHCELSNRGLKLDCAFRGVVRAELG